MSFSLFCLFFVATWLLCWTFLNFGKSKRKEEGRDTSNKAGLAVTGAIVLGWILLQVATPDNIFPFKNFIFGLYPFLIAAAALSMYLISSGKIRRFWIYLFVTLLSVVFLPDDWLVFQGYLPLIYDRFAAAVLWALFMCVYTRMDKVKGLTAVQTSALCLAFAIFPKFLLNKDTVQAFSGDFSFYPMIILAALIAFMNYQRRSPDIIMGKTGAVPLGYLMGLFLIFITVKGFWLAALIMPAYYYFEILYSAIYRLIERGSPEPVVFTFFISGVIRKSLNTKKLMPFMFLILLGFALSGFVFYTSMQLAFSIGALLLVYTIYRLRHWGEPKITYRSMFRDTKDAVRQIGSNIKGSYQEASDYLKNKK